MPLFYHARLQSISLTFYRLAVRISWVRPKFWVENKKEIIEKIACEPWTYESVDYRSLSNETQKSTKKTFRLNRVTLDFFCNNCCMHQLNDTIFLSSIYLLIESDMIMISRK